MKVLHCPQLDELFVADKETSSEITYSYEDNKRVNHSFVWTYGIESIGNMMKANDFNMYYVGEL